jgi:tetratricopeptide (TPR) repeat protein
MMPSYLVCKKNTCKLFFCKLYFNFAPAKRNLIMAKTKDLKEQEVTIPPIDLTQDTENVLESAEALQERIAETENYAKGHSKLIFGGAAAILLLVGGFVFFQMNREKSNAEAQKELFPAQFYLEKDSSKTKALQGDDNFSTIGISAIAEKYSGTKAAELANFYLGVAKLKEGKYDEAITALEKFNPNDYILQARTYSLIGDAHSEKKDWSNAAKYYQKAADYNPNEEFTPAYLLKLAQVHEANNNLPEAIKAYSTLIEKFESSGEKPFAEKMKVKLETKLNK